MTARRPTNAGEKTAEHVEWEKRIERMGRAVDAWRELTKSVPDTEVGSPLAADSVDGLAVGHPVWHSIGVSAEHLGFAIDAMRATSTLYPTAYLTVGRTAYIAAANAVWVLGPTSRSERRIRALKMRADELRELIGGVRTMRAVEGAPTDARDRLVAQLQARQAQLQGVADRLGFGLNVPKVKVNQTDIILWVAKHMHGIEDDLLVGGSQHIWRTSSAAAHGHYQFGVMRMDRNDVLADGSGSHVMHLRGDLENDIGPMLAVATTTLNEALKLYEARRVNHLTDVVVHR